MKYLTLSLIFLGCCPCKEITHPKERLRCYERNPICIEYGGLDYHDNCSGGWPHKAPEECSVSGAENTYPKEKQ